MQNLLLDDFRNYHFIDNLKLSPSGKNIALLGRKANADNGYDVAVFIDKGCGFKALTSLTGKVGQFLWLDDETILFSETRDKKDKEKQEKGYELTCFYKINIHGGEAEFAFKVDAVVAKLELLECGKFIATTIFDNARPSFEGKSEEEIGKILAELKKAKGYKVVDELPFWFNGKGFTNKKRIRLSILTEEGLKPITDQLTNVADYKFSDCKKYLAYVGDMAPADIHKLETNIHIVNLETLEEFTALSEPKMVRAFAFWKDKIVASFAEPGCSIHTHGPFYVVDPKTKEAKKLCDFDRSIGQPGSSDSKFGGGIVAKVVGDSLFFVSLCGFNTDIFELTLNKGEINNITNSGGNIDFFDMESGRNVFSFMPPGKLMEVFEQKDAKLVKLSSFNDEIHETRKYSAPEHFVFSDVNGIDIDGWVIKPADYEAGKKYPAVLEIHGGPKAAYTESYFHEMQLFANNGYFVMFSNPRGGDGKGNEFADIRGKYGTVDYDNLMLFVDKCIEKYPDIDEDKMGVLGGSYGGFMTNWITSHTHRFKAAVTMRCICNWMSFSFVSDIGYYFGMDQMGVADPIDEADKMWWHSPLKYVKEVKTPTLVLHSDEDFRCWVPEGIQWYTALKVLGVDTRLVIFHGENHELSRSGKPDLRSKRLDEIMSWMDKYLK